MRIVMDACTIILLAKATVLETVTNSHEISVTNDVFSEVIKGKISMFQDALILERLHNQKKILVIKYNTLLKNKISKDFNMGEGEASTIAAGIEKDYIVATDNRQGRKAALINNIPLIGSIEVIVNLYKRKRISYEKALASLKILNEEGWFDNYLIEKAKEDIK